MNFYHLRGSSMIIFCSDIKINKYITIKTNNIKSIESLSFNIKTVFQIMMKRL